MHKITSVLAQDILKWFDEKENKFNKDVKISQIFNNLKNQKLKNSLKRRRNQLSQRITDLENYLQSLERVVLLINNFRRSSTRLTTFYGPDPQYILVSNVLMSVYHLEMLS